MRGPHFSSPSSTTSASTTSSSSEEPSPSEPPALPSVELEQLQELWQRSVLSAVSEKSIPTSSMLTEARPVALDDDTLTIEFPQTASFHRKLAEEPKNATLLRDTLFELTGRRLALEFVLGTDVPQNEPAEEAPAGEEEIYQLVKDTFDAKEITE